MTAPLQVLNVIHVIGDVDHVPNRGLGDGRLVLGNRGLACLVQFRLGEIDRIDPRIPSASRLAGIDWRRENHSLIKLQASLLEGMLQPASNLVGKLLDIDMERVLCCHYNSLTRMATSRQRANSLVMLCGSGWYSLIVAIS